MMEVTLASRKPIRSAPHVSKSPRNASKASNEASGEAAGLADVLVRSAVPDGGERASAAGGSARGMDSLGDELGAAELARRVADNLRRKRKARGMSLDDLAKASGVS